MDSSGQASDTKLSAKDLVQIKVSVLSERQLAAKYGVSKSYIHKIRSGKK